MAILVYSTIASLDGYVADETGGFDWAMPGPATHQFLNDLERPFGTHLYGRRMYEVMSAWETLGDGDEPDYIRDYASVWRAAEKIVYSSTLSEVAGPRTRIERSFDPDAVRKLKSAATRPISISGPTLAGQALAAGLVDSVQLIAAPVIVGGGTRALPCGVRIELELLEERRFDDGMIFMSYRVNG